MEENLSRTKKELTILQIFTDQLKLDLEYFQKKNQKVSAIQSINIQKNDLYFREDCRKELNQDIQSSDSERNELKEAEKFDQIIKESDLTSCWLTQKKSFKYYMPEFTLNLSQSFLDVSSVKSSILALKFQMKNNTSENFGSLTVKISSSPSKEFNFIVNNAILLLDIVLNISKFHVKNLDSMKKEKFEIYIETLDLFQKSLLKFEFLFEYNN